MLSPIKTLFMYFPLTFFLRVLFLLAIDVATAVLMYKRYKKKLITKNRAYAVTLLVTYITIVLFFTLLGRRSLEYHRFGLDIVSYYTELFSGNGNVDITELILNILMFVPIGVLTCFVFERYKVFLPVTIGLCVSVFIELLQYLLRSGYVSATDVIHNTLGALIGGLLGIAVICVVKIVGGNSKAKVEKR